MSSDILSHAIALRKQGRPEESRQLLLPVVDSAENKGAVYLNIAWSCDNQGLEQDALHYYRLSLNEPLSEDDRFEALFGLACTYRCLGASVKAVSLFEQLRENYPEASEVIPFYALCLSSQGRKDEAIRLLFNLLLDAPSCAAIESYKKMLSDYVDAEYPAAVQGKVS